MIKKISILIIMVSLSIVYFFLAGCDDSMSSKEDSLVDTWILTNLKYVFSDFTMNVDPSENNISMRMTFKSDNTFQVIQTEGNQTYTSSGTWSISAKKISFNENGEEYELEYSLKEDKLEISFEDELEGEPFTEIQIFSRD
ncbi:MAG: lipocalin family protein [Calditrichaceae bacterium]|jgi:uncharacterized lipoprotein YehR (DUF1307 family)